MLIFCDFWSSLLLKIARVSFNSRFKKILCNMGNLKNYALKYLLVSKLPVISK